MENGKWKKRMKRRILTTNGHEKEKTRIDTKRKKEKRFIHE